MDRSQQDANQRVQQVKRTAGDWELLALKLQLLDPGIAKHIRDTYTWKQWEAYVPTAKVYMTALGVWGTCAPSTFMGSMTAALRRLDRKARQEGWRRRNT